MICVHCDKATEGVPCVACGDEPRLAGRYRLEEVLGRGAAGTTWRGVDADGRVFAVKERLVRGDDADKRRELVEREARVLRQLSHPAIPAFHEAIWVGTGKARHLYLVQEYVEGVDLQRTLDDHRFTEEEVRDVVRQVLAVLDYLHGLSPPVLHRDVKPSNLVRRPDGRIALVDFGSVRDVLVDPDLGGSTAVGTHGYAPPEQLVGDAGPGSDLYALAATAVHLLTRTPPRKLLGADMRLAWRDHVRVSPEFGAWLDRCLEPDWSRRPSDTGQARASLDAPPSRAASLPDRPRNTPVRTADRPGLLLEEPPQLPGPPRAAGESPRLPEQTLPYGRQLAAPFLVVGTLLGLAAVAATVWVVWEADAIVAEIETPESPLFGIEPAPEGAPYDFVRRLPDDPMIAYADPPQDCVVDATVTDGRSNAGRLVSCMKNYYLPKGAMDRVVHAPWPVGFDGVVRVTMATPAAVVGQPDSRVPLPAAGVEVAVPGAEACQMRLVATGDHLSGSTCIATTEGTVSRTLDVVWLGPWTKGNEVPVSVVPALGDEVAVTSTWGWSDARLDGLAKLDESVNTPIHREQPKFPLDAFAREAVCRADVGIEAGVPTAVRVSGCDLALHDDVAESVARWRWDEAATGRFDLKVKFVP